MGSVAEQKQALRRELLVRRRHRPEPERSAARAALQEKLISELRGAGTVCGYFALPSEPLGVDLLELFAGAGTRVLVPRAAPDRALDWCHLGSATQRGAFGIVEPVGPGLGVRAVLDADVLLIPALAVDARGVRLGRGGGHYDRTLAIASERADARWIGVVFDDERPATLPAEPCDLPVREVATPAGGVTRIGV